MLAVKDKTMANQDKIVLCVPVQGTTISTAYISTSGYYDPIIYLEAGWRYYVEDAYLTCSTTYTAGANSQPFKLYDTSGNCICTAATGPTTAAGTAFASFDSTYRDIDASSTANCIKCGFTSSGSGTAYLGVKLNLVIVRKKSASAI